MWEPDPCHLTRLNRLLELLIVNTLGLLLEMFGTCVMLLLVVAQLAHIQTV